MSPIELALRDLWNAAEEKLAHARSSSVCALLYYFWEYDANIDAGTQGCAEAP